MNRWIGLASLSAALVASAPASADVEDELKRRWVGAFAIVAVESASDCAGFYTNTEVRGRLASSKGRERFEPGELARVDKINVKSDRVDIFLTVTEPLLVARRDGPFELYDERTCKVQLMVDVSRDALASGRGDLVEEALRPAVEGFATRAAAEASPAWNGRRRAAYPEGYDLTLARHAAWVAEQENARLAALRGRAADDAAAVVGRIVDEPAYLDGFAAGVEALRSWRPGSCGSLTGASFASVEESAPHGHGGDGAAEKAWRRGFRDGQELAFSIAVLREVDGCFVPVPAVPAPAS